MKLNSCSFRECQKKLKTNFREFERETQRESESKTCELCIWEVGGHWTLVNSMFIDLHSE